MGSYDSVIIGAGHNGLVCAAYLAKKGQSVLVLEAADAAGGMAANREFHAGFQSPVAHSCSHFSSKVAAELNLSSHGFRTSGSGLPVYGLNPKGETVCIRQGTLSGVTEDDERAFSNYSAQMQRFADALSPFWQKTIPRIGNNSLKELLTFAHMGLNIRRLGKKDMEEFLRIASLPVRDLMDEFFDSPVLKAMLSWDGLIGSKMAPRSPNSAVLALLYRMSEGGNGTHVIPSGGVQALAGALVSAAESAGAEIRLQSAVSRVAVAGDENGLRVSGVELAGGESIHCDRVISSADPQSTFLDLVGVEYLDIGFTNRIRRIRSDGYVGKLHLALDSLPQFNGMERPDGRIIIAPEMDAIEFAFDDAKYGQPSEHPVMEITIPSLHEPSLAPDGQHVLSAHVMYIPYAHRDGWNDLNRHQVRERCIDSIEQYSTGIREQILGQEFLTPADLEREYRVRGGHWHHGEFAMDQLLMMRPTYGAAQYTTPIPGLYLCGAGSHPAGDLTGMAGYNAAREVLK